MSDEIIIQLMYLEPMDVLIYALSGLISVFAFGIFVLIICGVVSFLTSGEKDHE